MRGYRDVVCFAGCHGKSSTTGIATHIALEAALDPSVMIGAELPVIGGNYRIGAGELFLAEACEYCDSFLHFPPTVAVLNNIEEDHLDYFKKSREHQAFLPQICGAGAAGRHGGRKPRQRNCPRYARRVRRTRALVRFWARAAR